MPKFVQFAEQKITDMSNKKSKKIVRVINETIELLDKGKIRVAEKEKNQWIVNQWIKKSILLSFRVNEMKKLKVPYGTWFDKVDGKTVRWSRKKLIKAGFRSVPNGVIRKGSFIAKMLS